MRMIIAYIYLLGKLAYYLIVVDCRVTNPQISFDKGPKRHRGTCFDRHSILLSTARSLFSLKLLLKSSFEWRCWWKPNQKLGTPKSLSFLSRLSKQKIKLEISWDTQFSMPTGCTVSPRQNNEGTQLLPFSAQSGGDKRVQEFSFPWIWAAGDWFCHWSQTQQRQLIGPVYLIESQELLKGFTLRLSQASQSRGL